MKNRRGISSVVGTVFAIIALSTTVGYITYSMTVLDQYNQSVLARNQQAADTVKEKSQISSVTIVNNKLNITLTNTGSLPVNFTKIWITDKSTTNWVKSYVPRICAPSPNTIPPCLVATGNTLINLGQDAPASLNLNTAHAYHVKLVTSRGNTNEFDINSVGTVPLNIQLLAMPPSVASGFKTQLVMTVTNNGTSMVTDLVPVLTPNGVPTATCISDPVSPPKYATLFPGSTAIFSWAVKATGISDGQSCSYGAYLQNGYSKNYANATITTKLVTFGNTNLAQNTGILTLNYTTFRWTQGNTWNTGWSFPSGTNTVLKMNMTNNNSTSDFYISANTQIYYSRTAGANSGQFFLANKTSSLSPLALQSYTCPSPNDYCIKIPAGQSITLYFGASSKQGSGLKSIGQTDNYFTIILLYGKFSTSQAASGNSYAQSLPYIALVGT